MTKTEPKTPTSDDDVLVTVRGYWRDRDLNRVPRDPNQPIGDQTESIPAQ